MSLTILNTRPAHQASDLTKLLKNAGMRVVELPALEIKPARFTVANLSKIDQFIFLSANAVDEFFKKTKTATLSNKTIIAIGPATKDSLNSHHINNVIIPSQFNSEGLLQLPTLKDPKNSKIAIISGKNPKPMLSDTLLERGANIQNITCYERICAQYDMSKVFRQLEKESIDIIISTSLASLTCLLSIFKDNKQANWLKTIKLCVINSEMRNYAICNGIKDVIQAENATDEALLQKIRDNT